MAVFTQFTDLPQYFEAYTKHEIITSALWL